MHAIRCYVAEKLVPRAGKTDGGHGLFDRDAMERLAIIRAARDAGLPLESIRPLLHALNRGEPAAVAASIAEVDHTLQRCQQQLAALSVLLQHLRDAGPPVGGRTRESLAPRSRSAVA
ncbi:MerR family mercuric resistance operon transcriptional regulator [Paraburkholderia fungorum]|uniref:MerR family mercuric resistance operon transcriptional regulator n=1 Tax=Paraburkholderia fungorum TaxID=134537 RepID=A0AAW3V461_9BURK|nr:MerR family mercuric resistance operon transcriptional regulator [Paraburkholderia fungorum]